MYVRLFYICSLVTIALTLVYGNKTLTTILIVWQTQFHVWLRNHSLEFLTSNWTSGRFGRYMVSGFLYALAVGFLVLAVRLFTVLRTG